MRPNLFNANIAGKIATGLGKHMLAATLHRKTPGTRDPADPTAGLTVGASVADYGCRGMTADYTDKQIDGTLIKVGDRKILLLGGTLPDVIDPAPGDDITIEGRRWVVIRAQRDPAGAGFTCQVRAK